MAPSHNELQEVMNLIGTHYVFDGRSYPMLRVPRTDDEKWVFVISHSLLHMQKSSGVLARNLEAHDHGGTIDDQAVRLSTIKMFINTLKLAEELGMSADDLCKAVHEFYKAK